MAAGTRFCASGRRFCRRFHPVHACATCIGFLTVGAFLMTVVSFPEEGDLRQNPEAPAADAVGGSPYLLMGGDVPPAAHPDTPRPRAEPPDHANVRADPDAQRPGAAPPGGPSNLPFGLPPVVPDGIPKILLVTSYRGGSSFLGKLLDIYPDPESPDPPLFYWYEPLLPLYKDFYKRTARERNPSYHGYSMDGQELDNVTAGLVREAVRELRAVLTCDVESLPVKAHLHPFVSRLPFGARIGARYRPCMREKALKNMEIQLPKCLPRLREACETARARAVKTIRVSLRVATLFLELFPEAKVLFLVRDPRGVLASRRYMEPKKYGPDAMGRHAEEHCGNLEQDLDTASKVKATASGGRLLHVSFESLAGAPQATAREVYDFLGWRLTEEVAAWLEENTQQNPVKFGFQVRTNPFIVQRNSSAVVASWRRSLPLELQKIITSRCQGVLRTLGYDTEL